MTIASLTPAQVAALKARIWAGEFHRSVASQYGCSLPLVHKIAQGQRWAEIPWPDGSRGAIRESRMRAIMRARMKAHREGSESVSKSVTARVKAILEAAE